MRRARRRDRGHRDFPVLAVLFAETQRGPFAEVPVVGEPEFRDGTEPSAGIGQDAEYGAIAEGNETAMLAHDWPRAVPARAP